MIRLSVVATDVLLHATASTKNGSLVEVSIGNVVLHFLRSPERCAASVFSSGIVLKGMEVSRRIEEMVQACNTARRRYSYKQWRLPVLVL